MFLFTIFISIAFSGYGFHGGPGMMPIIPHTPYFECEGIPPGFCNLQMTKGQCVLLVSQNNKCDIAEKCDGRARRDCSKFWRSPGGMQRPNCVWIQLFGAQGKCDSAEKCQGRSQQTCTNHWFPPCMWMPSSPFHPGFGQCMEGGGSLMKTHEESSLESSTPAETDPEPTQNGPLLALGFVSFLVGLGFTFLILRCKKRRESTSELKETLDWDRRMV